MATTARPIPPFARAGRRSLRSGCPPTPRVTLHRRTRHGAAWWCCAVGFSSRASWGSCSGSFSKMKQAIPSPRTVRLLTIRRTAGASRAGRSGRRRDCPSGCDAIVTTPTSGSVRRRQHRQRSRCRFLGDATQEWPTPTRSGRGLWLLQVPRRTVPRPGATTGPASKTSTATWTGSGAPGPWQSTGPSPTPELLERGHPPHRTPRL
jgi:hypothetical protein